MAGTFKLERTKIEFDIYGEKFQVTRPSGGRLEAFFESLNDAQPEDVTAMTRTFLVGLGFSEEILKELEYDHLRQVMDQLTGVGKKSPTGS